MFETYICDYCKGWFISDSRICRRCQLDARQLATAVDFDAIRFGHMLRVPTPALDKQALLEHKGER